MASNEREGPQRIHPDTQKDSDIAVNPLLANIRLGEIVSAHRTRPIDVPYPPSRLFKARMEGNVDKVAESLQTILTKGRQIDWSTIPPDVVRELVVKTCEESDRILSLNLLSRHKALKRLEKYVQKATDNENKDVTYLLLSDLSLLPRRGQIVLLFQDILDRRATVP